MLLLTTSARALRPAARRLQFRRFHYQSGGKSSAGTAAAAVGCFAASAAPCFCHPRKTAFAQALQTPLESQPTVLASVL